MILLTFKSNLGLVNYSGKTTGENKDSDKQRKITDFLLALQQLPSKGHGKAHVKENPGTTDPK